MIKTDQNHVIKYQTLGLVALNHRAGVAVLSSSFNLRSLHEQVIRHMDNPVQVFQRNIFILQLSNTRRMFSSIFKLNLRDFLAFFDRSRT